MHPRQDVQNPDINLGVLLMEFFELYGRHFHYPMLCIRVKNGGQYITKEQVNYTSILFNLSFCINAKYCLLTQFGLLWAVFIFASTIILLTLFAIIS